MVVRSLLMDFSVDPSYLANKNKTENLIKDIENVFNPRFNLSKIYSSRLNDGNVVMYTGNMKCLLTLRMYDINNVLTITAEYEQVDPKAPLITLKDRRVFARQLVAKVDGLTKSQFIPDIKRGNVDAPAYFDTNDKRFLQYDIDKIVFDEQSPFQKVTILHSMSYGNILLLDNEQNIAESDGIYTDTLMQRGKESYCGKEILILGGGDGALLNELLKEKPKMVLMLELDEVVIRACREHFRSACGDVLDKLKGPNYEIILGDCMTTIDMFISQNRKFDYIFGDLTDVPFSEERTGSNWNFITNILQKSLKIMKPNGKFLTQCNALNAPNALKMYEEFLNELVPKVTFTNCTAFLPSNMVYWVFYQVSFAKK